MFPGCHPCSGSPALLRFDFEFACASSFVHLNALPVHALRQVIIQIPAFLRMICSWGCLITRKNAGIVPLALYESQMGGLNHMKNAGVVLLSVFMLQLGLLEVPLEWP